MTYKGFARGRMIELDGCLPFPEGQPLDVSVTPATPGPIGSAAVILRAMHEPPILRSEDVDELERVIGEGRLGVRDADIFDGGG